MIVVSDYCGDAGRETVLPRLMKSWAGTSQSGATTQGNDSSLWQNSKVFQRCVGRTGAVCAGAGGRGPGPGGAGPAGAGPGAGPRPGGRRRRSDS